MPRIPGVTDGNGSRHEARTSEKAGPARIDARDAPLCDIDDRIDARDAPLCDIDDRVDAKDAPLCDIDDRIDAKDAEREEGATSKSLVTHFGRRRLGKAIA
jgi:hypothetical protein